jgi:hypothetical protein
MIATTTCCMPEVPASAIPESAWGISGRVLTTGEMAAADPFGGTGVRLDIPAGREITVADVQAATKLEHVIVFPAQRIAWAERIPAIGDLAQLRWQAWLTREEVTEDT